MYLNLISLLVLNCILNVYMAQITSFHRTKEAIWYVGRLLHSIQIVHNETST